MAETAPNSRLPEPGSWRGATRLRRRILPSILKQLFQFHVEAFADAQAVTIAALKQCAGLIESLRFDAPFLKARDLHGGVEHLRLLFGRGQHSAAPKRITLSDAIP